jgi:phospholipid/cholesterol/gamma-HCH transport system substrate-binding protein
MRAQMKAGVAGALALGLGVLSGCGTTMRDLPIPGTGVSGDTVEVKAEFNEALNLASGAPVKVNGVDMGKVKDITVDDFVAEATLTLKEDAQLREGAHARLRYTTPLGELFVDITNPAQGQVLGKGAKLELKDTETAPTVEDALAQASLLINGGGLDQLQTVTEELNAALNGNEGDFRTLLDRATVFVTQANATTQSIDGVLNSLNSLSSTLSSRESTINRAVREIRPAAKVLREKTPELTRLLDEVEKFSGAANDVVKATRAQLLTMLREVEPVLAEFARNNGVFDDSLRAIIQAAASADEAVATDYLNISLQLHLDGIQGGDVVGGTVAALLGLLGLSEQQLGGGIDLDNLLGGLNLSGLGLASGARATGGSAKPSTSKSGKKSGKPGTSGMTSAPLGMSGILNSLLGGGR